MNGRQPGPVLSSPRGPPTPAHPFRGLGARRVSGPDPRRALVTGGAGFIGSSLADLLATSGSQVTLVDNLSRWGSRRNLAWLRERHGQGLHFIEGDLRDPETAQLAARDQEVIYHLAGQTAVTTSVADPRQDFGANAVGTFNLLEGARAAASDPIFLYSSTNKVYGALEDVPLVKDADRYAYASQPFGIAESQPLDFHSPYGCSKGAADQYVRDYSRTYGLRSVVFRQSCIYGPRQMGVEDQGWVAWFVIAAITGRPITVYGDGKQVRDLLYIDDLLLAYEAAVRQIDVARGQVYNLGGGPDNALAIWRDFGPLLGELLGHPVEPAGYADWRIGDQLVFVSDIRKAEQELGWHPQVGPRAGIGRLVDWVSENLDLFRVSP